MSATDTAQRVIEWACLPDEGRGMLPQGDISVTERLAHPPQDLRASLARLASLTTARLHLEMPPLGDSTPLGIGTLIIAAAIGFSNFPQGARVILSAVPSPKSPVEWVARHGLVAPALPYLPEVIADECLMTSPLTALLACPAKGQEIQTMDVMYALLEHPAGRLSLTLQLAQPALIAPIRLWRQELLERLRLTKPDFVIDVYEATMIYHQVEALEQVKLARAVITDPLASSNENLLGEALSIAEWWGPLWALERSSIDKLRSRRYLAYPYREGISLYNLMRKMRGLS